MRWPEYDSDRSPTDIYVGPLLDTVHAVRYHWTARPVPGAGGEMIIVMLPEASPADVEEVIRQVEATGFRPFINPGVERKVIALLGEMDIDKVELVDRFGNLPGVERVQLI